MLEVLKMDSNTGKENKNLQMKTSTKASTSMVYLKVSASTLTLMDQNTREILSRAIETGMVHGYLRIRNVNTRDIICWIRSMGLASRKSISKYIRGCLSRTFGVAKVSSIERASYYIKVCGRMGSLSVI
jgi:hypothetical protein